MLSFTQFLKEYVSDPVALAQRAARRFGKRTSFGKWEKVERGGHIPLTSYDRRKSESAAVRDEKVRSHLEKKEKGSFFGSHTIKNMKIADLHATQPFVRTHDVDRLKAKIDQHEPTHVRVITHLGKHYIADGHHSVMAAKMRGDTHINVKHLDYDAYPKRL